MSLARKVVLYEWPTSEPCHGCINGIGLMDNQWGSDKIDNIEMAAICLISCHRNTGVDCAKRTLINKEDDNILDEAF